VFKCIVHIDISNTFLFTIIIIKLTSIGLIFSKTIQEVNLTLGEHHKVVKTGNEVKAEIDVYDYCEQKRIGNVYVHYTFEHLSTLCCILCLLEIM
jgi:cytidylate kinase